MRRPKNGKPQMVGTDVLTKKFPSDNGKFIPGKTYQSAGKWYDFTCNGKSCFFLPR